jgi:hypothetical protein
MNDIKIRSGLKDKIILVFQSEDKMLQFGVVRSFQSTVLLAGKRANIAEIQTFFIKKECSTTLFFLLLKEV